MFKKILVPLDGSKLAECALEYAEELAKNCGSTELVLVSVTERVVATTVAPEAGELYRSSSYDRVTGIDASTQPFPPGMPGKPDAKIAPSTIILGKKGRQAWNYLNRVAKKIKAKGIPVNTDVLVGNVADQIVSYAEQGGFDTIVMASHGRSGPSRWAMGSTSDKVFRASCIPVLMIRAPGCFPGV
jgi:nucleotide-binding universal stress UspA family protein